MPLIKSKSKAAFGKNVATEVKAGKPVKQAVAIAYSTKRAAPVKKARGGSTNPMDYDSDVDYYEAVKSSGAHPKARQWARESLGEPMDAAYFKKKAEAKKVADDAFYAKHAAANAEREKKSREMTNKRRASSGLPPLKSGGSTNKGGW